MKRKLMKQIRLSELEALKLKSISKGDTESEIIRNLIEEEFNRQRKKRNEEAKKQLKIGSYNIEGLETLEITNLVDDLSNEYKLIIDRFNNEILLKEEA